MQRFFTLGQGGSLQPGLGFRARSCQVDNPGGQWVHFPDVEAFVQPFSRGAVVTFGTAVQNPRVDTQAPSGGFQQTVQLGQAATLRFSDTPAAPVAGTPLPVPASLTFTMAWSFAGTPGSDSYLIFAATSFQSAIGSGRLPASVDLVSFTIALQTANLPPGVLTASVALPSGPTLALPPSGILTQAFPGGAVRTSVPVSPGLTPGLIIANAGGGSQLLTQGQQTVRAQGTYQIALY